MAVSTDRGGTWTQTATAPTDTVFGLAPDPADPARVHAATSGGVWRTIDFGATWTRVLAGRGLRAIALRPGSADSLIVAGDEGAWLSADRGGSWAEMNDGLDVRAVASLCFGGPDRARLFAGTRGGAVYAWQFPTALAEPRAAPGRTRVIPAASLTAGRLGLESGLRGADIGLYDAVGRCVLRSVGRAELDLNGLSPGVYTLASDGRVLRRVVKIE